MDVYVDTGAWVAYFDQSDRFHPIVKPYLQKAILVH
jgi:predicted nucleic acid-binding protein